MLENQGDLLRWAEENAKKESEEKRLKQLEFERAEDEEERKKLYKYGPGEKVKEMGESAEIPERKIARTNLELWVDKDHENAIDEDGIRENLKKIQELKKRLKKDKIP